jgi:tRNA-2-methylthio-N6-dimethylallyladenosine synthase
MAAHPNICKHIHLPVQSGSSRMLALMRRKYDREWYMERVAKIREVMPDCGLTTDVIAGFCTETEQDHADTVSLMDQVGFDWAFMFAYSDRPGTLANRTMQDDVPADVKNRRLSEIIDLQNRKSLERYRSQVGKELEVLVEGPSKRDPNMLCGRASNNMMCVFPATGRSKGTYTTVKVVDCTSATLICE